MSIRAYRVRKIDCVTPDSFNLWRDDKLVEFFGNEYGFFVSLAMDASGITELPVEALEQAISKAKELDLNEDIVKALKTDIEAAKAEGNTWVSYYCF